MKTLLILLFTATPAFAECPVQHPALTGLDRAAMVDAYSASFRGLFGRDPTGRPGSGSDDTNYWVMVSDHYGEFSDGVCRAGWSAYWEAKVAGADSVDPRLGDQPARFKPMTAPPVVTPPAVPLPSTDLSPVLNRLMVDAATRDAQFEELKAYIDAKTQAIRDDIKSFRDAANQTIKVILKYAGPAIAALLAGRATK